MGVEFDTVNSRDRIELTFDAATGRLIERRTVYVVPPEGTSIPPGPASILRYDAPQVVAELGP